MIEQKLTELGFSRVSRHLWQAIVSGLSWRVWVSDYVISLKYSISPDAAHEDVLAVYPSAHAFAVEMIVVAMAKLSERRGK